MQLTLHGETKDSTLFSYEEHQFGWAEDVLLEGSVDAARNGDGVLCVYHEDSGLSPGDTVTISGKELTICGVLSSVNLSHEPGSEEIICSEELFTRLTGQSGYSVINIQLVRGATDADVDRIRALGGEDNSFSDQRISNRETRGAYYSFLVFIYGFLAIIALISVVNIINTISLSVSSRMKQYGVMRAIGMSTRQLIRMVCAETLTYTLWGIVTGCILGLLVHQKLFAWMITSRWGDSWKFPGLALCVILAAMSGAVAAAVRLPAKRFQEIDIVDTIRGE